MRSSDWWGRSPKEGNACQIPPHGGVSWCVLCHAVLARRRTHPLPLIAKCKLQSAKKGFLFFAQRSARGVLDAINWGAKVRFRPLKVHKSMCLPTQNVPFSALFWMPFRGQKNRGWQTPVRQKAANEALSSLKIRPRPPCFRPLSAGFLQQNVARRDKWTHNRLKINSSRTTFLHFAFCNLHLCVRVDYIYIYIIINQSLIN